MPIDKKLPVALTVKRPRTLKLRGASQVSRTAKPKVALSETGWIGTTDAVYLLAPHFGGEERAKAELMLRLSRGDLTCRAACWCQEADRGKVDKHDIDWGGYNTSRPHGGQFEPTIFDEPKEEEGRVFVPKDIFLTSHGWTINTQEADWKLGYFIGRKPVELLTDATIAPANHKFIRRFACGLEFHLSEIAALMPLGASLSWAQSEEEATGGVSTIRSSNRGRKKSDPWNVWIAEVMVFLESNGFEDNFTKPDFHTAINGRLEKRDGSQELLPYTTVEKAIGAIIMRLREAKVSGEIQS